MRDDAVRKLIRIAFPHAFTASAPEIACICAGDRPSRRAHTQSPTSAFPSDMKPAALRRLGAEVGQCLHGGLPHKTLVGCDDETPWPPGPAPANQQIPGANS
jgi:hypothetical protein